MSVNTLGGKTFVYVGHLSEASSLSDNNVWFMISVEGNIDLRYKTKRAVGQNNGMAVFDKKFIFEAPMNSTLRIKCYSFHGTGDKMGKKHSKFIGEYVTALGYWMGVKSLNESIGSLKMSLHLQLAPCIISDRRYFLGEQSVVDVNGTTIDANRCARGENKINGKSFDCQGFGQVWGKLKVLAIDAKEVPKMDILGKCDPFLSFHHPGHISLTTKVIKNTYTPVWNESLVTEIGYLDKLEVKFWDWDLLSGNDLIGAVLVDLTTLNVGKENELTLNFPEKAKKKPVIRIQITLTPYDNSGYFYAPNLIFKSVDNMVASFNKIKHKEAKKRHKRLEKERKEREEREKKQREELEAQMERMRKL